MWENAAERVKMWVLQLKSPALADSFSVSLHNCTLVTIWGIKNINKSIELVIRIYNVILFLVFLHRVVILHTGASFGPPSFRDKLAAVYLNSFLKKDFTYFLHVI